MKDTTLTTPGRQLLAEALKKKRDAGDIESQAYAARKMDISPGFMSHLLSGRKKPGRQLSVKLRDAYGVPIDAW